MPSEAHEQLAQLIADNPTPLETPMADRRAGYDQFLLSMPVADDVADETVDANGVSLSWVTTPAAREDRVVLHVHGGGGTMGSAATYREFASRLSRAIEARVAVPDYRLAPEAPFPAGVDDVLTAYGWLLAEGIAADRIVVSADSAGVGLALVALTRIRDEGLDVPAGLIGFTPWIDFAVGETIASADDVGDPVSTPDALRFFADQLLQGHAATSPLANALHANLSGLPPLLLIPATRDVGYRDALRMAELARAAGVPVRVETFHGLIHNFQMAAHLPEAAEALEAGAAFAAEALDGEVALTQERVA